MKPFADPMPDVAASPARSALSAPAVTFWGVRGSIPVPGPETVVFGGHTTCLEISLPEQDPQHVIVIDAGSGLQALGLSRNWDGVRRIDLLLTHLHHDHIIGLPFFRAMFLKGMDVHVWCGSLDGATAEAALGQMFAPPLFPLRLQQLPANLTFHGFKAGETLQIEGHLIRTVLLDHPSGATGFRFDAADGSVAIITDIEHKATGSCPHVVALCQGVDTLIYDSMLEECDYGRCKGWGHSTLTAGIDLGRAAGARRLIGFHHAPEHTDAIMAIREAKLQQAWPGAVMARERQTISCGPAA